MLPEYGFLPCDGAGFAGCGQSVKPCKKPMEDFILIDKIDLQKIKIEAFMVRYQGGRKCGDWRKEQCIT